MHTLDVSATAVISPGGNDFDAANCSIQSFPTPKCPEDFTPRVKVTNLGLSTITSITITTIFNGTDTIIQILNTSITIGKTKTFILANRVSVVGNNILNIILSNPNGGTDENPANNTISTSFIITPASNLPFTQDFVSTTFPPTGIAIINPDGGITWSRKASGYGSLGSAFINCYNYSLSGQTDDIKLNAMNTNIGDTVLLTFDVSYKPYDTNPASNTFDTLTVLYSNACSSLWTQSSYKKWGSILATDAASTSENITPTLWRTDSVIIVSTSNSLVVAIRCINKYGNNIFIDNINFKKKVTPHVYTFTGNGNWTVPSNWLGNTIPPDSLPAGSIIYISPIIGGVCILNISQTILAEASIIITNGSKLVDLGNLIINGDLPTLITKPISEITETSAISGGNITNIGGSPILARGVVWDTVPNPTIVKNKTIDGIGISSINSYLSGLSFNKTYYLRAYATNSSGTAYGNEFNFKTQQPTSDTICSQIWMQKNLNLTTYKNGDPIPQVTNPLTWSTLTTGAWSYYNNDSTTNSLNGKLYNWYAVNDSRGLAPSGWHIPSDTEWTTLSNCLGGDSLSGGAMKEVGTLHWTSPNTGATNTSGFTALPCGYRNSDNGTYSAVGLFSYWWSSTQFDSSLAWVRYLYFNVAAMGRGYDNKRVGYSVRCLRD